MPKKPKTPNQLVTENADLRARLDEAEDALRAIRSGEVDALVVATEQGERVFTLKGADHSYRILIEEMNEGALTFSLDGAILYCNRRFAEMLKTPLEKVIGSAIHTWIAPDSQKTLQALVRREDTQTRRQGEATLLASDGTSVTAYLSLNDLQIEEISGYFCMVATDLTEQKRSEGIVAAEKLSRELLAASNQSRLALLSVVEDLKQAQEETNRHLKRLNALHLIDLAISSSFDLHLVLDIVLQQVLAQLGVDAAAILLLNPQLQTIEYAASQGFRSNALQHTQLQLNEGYAGRAVHERKTIYIPALLATDGKLAEVMRAANEDFVDYYGTPLVSKDGIKGVLEIYHRSALHPNPEWLDFLETLAGQAAIAIDNAQLFDGLQRANAELEQRVAQRTAELNQTNIELEHANRAKDEFLATMSHELRTPLNSILGLSESLLEQRRDPLSEYQQRSLLMIQSGGSHLLALINDILDLSKIEAGKFDYYPQIISVSEMCRSSLAFVKEQSIRKSITIAYQEELAVSEVYADPRRLKQILVNLLTNAVKFTRDHGQVILQVHTDSEQDRIQFSVIDSGIGIAPEDLRQLFVPFKQVDSSLTREHEGTGLGLALVQRLTDLHAGSVEVESEVGKGSRFTINLPLERDMIAQHQVIESGSKLLSDENAGKTDVPALDPVDHGMILLAEDNMANVLTIGDYLESRGYQIVVAHDGLEALAKAEEHKPNLILMDIQMPALNGLEAIQRLRGDPRFASTPIIALTALAMPGDRERCLEAGANEYMSKPASLKMLLNMIRKFLAK